MNARTYSSSQPHVAMIGPLMPMVAGSSTTTDTVIFVQFQYQLHYLLQVRQQIPEHQKVSINLLIVNGLTSFIESVFSNILNEIIESLKSASKNITIQNILNAKQKEIHSTAFEGYSKILNQFTGKRFSDLVSDQAWKCIDLLFFSRNKITHGAHISMTISLNESGKYNYQYNDDFGKLRNYILEKKLLSKEEIHSNNEAIFSDKIINLFIETSIPAVNEICETLSNEHQIMTWNQIKPCMQNLIHIATNVNTYKIAE